MLGFTLPESRPVIELVLASSSPHRRELLARLGIPFEAVAPALDETPLPGESPADLVARLSRAKARAVAPRFPGAVVVGSDQVAVIPHQPASVILGKPEDRAAAIEQLGQMSARNVSFLTGICVVDPRGGDELELDETRVSFRGLGETEIAAYVDREQPYGCAGSFRSERLGVTLVTSIRSDDPNALIGLPLIRLCRMLRRAGLDPLHPEPERSDDGNPPKSRVDSGNKS